MLTERCIEARQFMRGLADRAWTLWNARLILYDLVARAVGRFNTATVVRLLRRSNFKA
jgi:hypothetical protein